MIWTFEYLKDCLIPLALVCILFGIILAPGPEQWLKWIGWGAMLLGGATLGVLALLPK